MEKESKPKNSQSLQEDLASLLERGETLEPELAKEFLNKILNSK